MRAASIVLVLLLLLVAGPASAQSHDHGAAEGPVAFVLRDGPTDGRAVVGGLTHFGFALLDENGVPTPHRDAQVLVTQNGRTLLETGSTHEYDGLFSLDVTFAEPGPYEVVATSEGFEAGRFGGTAVLPADETQARIEADVVPTGPGIVQVEIRILDAQGAILPHTDALLETRDASGKLIGRTHTHIHDAPIRFHQRVGQDELTLQVTAFNAFPTGNRPDFRAIVADFTLASPGLAPPAAPAVAEPQSPAALISPAGASASDADYTLHGMYDPQPLVGLGNPIRLAGLLTDVNGTPVQHIDFQFEVIGPEGLAWSSESLHEYDGMFEWAWTPALPGEYSAVLTVERGDTTLTVPYRFTVAPPVIPLNAGPNTVRIEGIDAVTALTAAELTFLVENEAGVPVDHSEVDITIYRAGEPAFQQFKLHGHAGVTTASIAFPGPGEWLVRVDPFALLPQAALFEPVVVAVHVGDALPGIETAATDTQEGEQALRNLPLPSALAPLAAAMAALVMAALVPRRPR